MLDTGRRVATNAANSMPLVFDTKPGSGYDDHEGESYHFPNRYLSTAQSRVGDWVLYRKPRRGEGQPGYFGVARLRAIEPDPRDPKHSYARLERYLAFDAVVPQEDSDGQPYEAILDLPRFRGEVRCWVSVTDVGLRRPPCRCSSLVRPQRSPFLHPGPCAGSAVAHSPCQARADCAPARACA